MKENTITKNEIWEQIKKLQEQIDQVCDDVTQSLLKDFEREVDSAEIGERVMASLRKLDQVAYVRFASVYRQFQAASDFISEIKGLKK